MVILGGLEIVAAGFLLNEFNKDKVEERTRRRHKQSSSHDHDHHNDDRPSRPPQANHDSNSLRPPTQNPPRPLSAPPVHEQGSWQQQPPSFLPQIQQYNQQPPPNSRPVQQWQPGPGPQPFPHFNNNNNNNGPPVPNPGALQRPHTFHPSQSGPGPQQQQQQFPQRFPSAQQQPSGPGPGPGALQRPNTFHPSQGPSFGPTPGPYLQQAGTFPLQQSQPNLRPQQNIHVQAEPLTTPNGPVKPGPTGPLQYIDSKTGRVFHNLYPPDHPMSRGNLAHDDSELPREVYFGDKPYDRQLPGDVHTGLLWTDADEDSLAYGKDYSSPMDRDRRDSTRRQGSYERRREGRRRRSSPPPAYGY